MRSQVSSAQWDAYCQQQPGPSVFTLCLVSRSDNYTLQLQLQLSPGHWWQTQLRPLCLQRQWHLVTILWQAHLSSVPEGFRGQSLHIFRQCVAAVKTRLIVNNVFREYFLVNPSWELSVWQKANYGVLPTPDTNTPTLTSRYWKYDEGEWKVAACIGPPHISPHHSISTCFQSLDK